MLFLFSIFAAFSILRLPMPTSSLDSTFICPYPLIYETLDETMGILANNQQRPRTVSMEHRPPRNAPPSPPSEASLRIQSTKRMSSSKSTKPSHRVVKRSSTSTVHSPTHSHSPTSPTSHLLSDGRHKRVWKACERCRMKKTKVRIMVAKHLQVVFGS